MSGLPEIYITRPLKECLSITGQRQSGKTRLLIELIKYSNYPMMIFDTLGVIAQSVQKGLLRLRRHQQLFVTNWSEKTLPPYDEAERKRFKLPEGTPTRLSVFLPFCQKVWNNDNCIAVIDEWHLFCNGKWGLPPLFGSLFNQAGNKNIAVWGTSQAPAQVHNDILRACRHHLIFSLWMPQDLRFMQDFIPKKYVESANGELAIDSLPEYNFFYYNTATKKAEFYDPLKL